MVALSLESEPERQPGPEPEPESEPAVPWAGAALAPLPQAWALAAQRVILLPPRRAH